MIEVKAISIPVRDRALEAADRLYLAAFGRGVLFGLCLMYLVLATFQT